MNKYISYKAIFFSLVLLSGALQAGAQQKTIVRAGADKSKILIGEQMLVTLEADIPENEPIHFFTIDTIPHFEILEKYKTDTSDTDKGTVLKQVIRITSFDSGHWVIPSFVFSENLATDSLAVDVVFSEFNPGQDYHDIKDIIEVNPKVEKKKWWLWYAIGGGALLMILLLILLLRKRKPAPPLPEIVIDAYDEAMKRLEKLRDQVGDKKQYYSALADIFRVYIDRKKGIHSLQKTTDDIVVQLRNIPVAREQFDNLSQSLRLIDFVKFAKYVPTPGDDLNTFETIKRTISEIEQLK